MGGSRKWTLIWGGAAIIVILAGITGLYFWSIPALSNFDETTEIAKDGVESLWVEAYLSDVNITSGGNVFSARLHGRSFTEEQYRARLSVSWDALSPGRLIIREYREAHDSRLTGDERLTLDIVIPEGYNTSVTVDNTSGDIRADGVNVHTWIYTTLSGDIEVKNSHFAQSLVPGFSTYGQGSANSGSGNAVIDNVMNDGVTIVSSSGKITATACKTGNLRAESIIGAVDILGADTGGLSVSTSSGAVNIDMAALTAEARLDSMSGKIALALPAGRAFRIEASSASGVVQTGYPSQEDGLPLTVATITGDIEIRAK